MGILKSLVKSQTKRKKKIEKEKPPSARRDMAKKDVFTGEKYLSDGPKNMPKRMTPEYKSFLNKQAKKANKKEKVIKTAIGTGVTSAVGAAMYAGGKREEERMKKDKQRINKIREAAKEKGNKTFTVDGLRYDTSTGRRKPLSAVPLLEATQRRIDFEKARDKKEKEVKPQKKRKGGLAKKGKGMGTKWESKWG